MIVHVITLFPELIERYFTAGLLGKARENGLLEIRTINLRDFGEGRHQVVDDNTYGGGVGMILKADVMARAIRRVQASLESGRPDQTPVALTTPHGRKFDSAVAREYSGIAEWILICGHYGGVDQRVADEFVTDEISIGDYVLMGGELPALVILEAAARFIPGVLGKLESAETDTFEDSLLGPPVYTRPPVFEGREIPEVLLSGHHAEIEKWRRRRQLELTLLRRPDLLEKTELSKEDVEFLEELGWRNKTDAASPPADDNKDYKE